MQALQRRKNNLERVLSIAKSMDTVVQGQVALQLTLPEEGTSSADFGGALDVLDVLRQALESGDVTGIHAFRYVHPAFFGGWIVHMQGVGSCLRGCMDEIDRYSQNSCLRC